MINFTNEEKKILNEANINPAHLQETSTDEEFDSAYDKLELFCMNNFHNHIPNDKAKICESIFDKLAEE